MAMIMQELKFNSKNLNELAQQEALIKYKRNVSNVLNLGTAACINFYVLAQTTRGFQYIRLNYTRYYCVYLGQVDELKDHIQR
jgi:hypothetical protein